MTPFAANHYPGVASRHVALFRSVIVCCCEADPSLNENPRSFRREGLLACIHPTLPDGVFGHKEL